MSGVIFVIVVPTANFEQEILNGMPSKLFSFPSDLEKFLSFCWLVIDLCFWRFQSSWKFCNYQYIELPPAVASYMQRFGGVVPSGTNNLNINLPDNNAVLRLEVELRDKNPRRRQNPRNQMRNKGFSDGGGDRKRTTPSTAGVVGIRQSPPSSTNANNFFVPMEKVSILSLFLFLVSFFMLILLFLFLLLFGLSHISCGEPCS